MLYSVLLKQDFPITCVYWRTCLMHQPLGFSWNLANNSEQVQKTGVIWGRLSHSIKQSRNAAKPVVMPEPRSSCRGNWESPDSQDKWEAERGINSRTSCLYSVVCGHISPLVMVRGNFVSDEEIKEISLGSKYLLFPPLSLKVFFLF